MNEKDLTKLKVPRHLCAMQYVRVLNSRAMVTDLGTYVETSCHEHDGLYNVVPWSKGVHVPCDVPVDEFPESPSFCVGSTEVGKIETKHMGDIVSALSDNQKFSIGGILFVPGSGKRGQLLVGTDGHRLHYSGDIEANQNDGFILTKETCIFLVMNDTWNVKRSEGFLIFTSTIGDVVCQVILDHRYPNYKSIMSLEGFIPIGNDDLVDFMGNFFREVKKTGARSRNNGFFVRAENGRFLCEQPVPEVADFFSYGPICQDVEINTALNGSYINDISKISGEKTVFYKDNDSNLHIKTESGACLLMPLNV